jgi:hypothetical protein
MSETITAAEKVQANWDALASDPIMGDPNFVPVQKEEKIEDKVDKDLIIPLEKEPEVKVEDKPEPDKKEEVKPDADPVDEFKVTLEDISGVPQKHPDGSYKHIAQQMGVEIEEESLDSFKSKFIPKEEAEKSAKLSKQELYSSLPPDIATAFQLKELGIPDDLILEPTKEIDGYLKLDDAQLVRANLAATEGWTEDMINTEMESLDEDKLSHEAKKLRLELNQQKKNIITTKENLVQQYTAEREQVALKLKEQEKTQFKEAMDKVSTFFGVTIPKEVKDALVTKYNNGLYDKDLTAAEMKANFILIKELGDKLTKHVRNKVSADVKKEATDKLLNIPPVKPGGGGKQETKEVLDNWGPIDDDFKN